MMLNSNSDRSVLVLLVLLAAYPVIWLWSRGGSTVLLMGMVAFGCALTWYKRRHQSQAAIERDEPLLLAEQTMHNHKLAELSRNILDKPVVESTADLHFFAKRAGSEVMQVLRALQNFREALSAAARAAKPDVAAHKLALANEQIKIAQGYQYLYAPYEFYELDAQMQAMLQQARAQRVSHLARQALGKREQVITPKAKAKHLQQAVMALEDGLDDPDADQEEIGQLLDRCRELLAEEEDREPLPDRPIEFKTRHADRVSHD